MDDIQFQEQEIQIAIEEGFRKGLQQGNEQIIKIIEHIILEQEISLKQEWECNSDEISQYKIRLDILKDTLDRICRTIYYEVRE